MDIAKPAVRRPGSNLRKAALFALLAAALGAPAGAAEVRNVPYVAVHEHLFKDSLPGDAEIEAFRKAGLGGLVLMWPDPAPVAALAKKNPGYVVPAISLSALQNSILTDGTASDFARARDQDGFCVFGEMATRLPASPNLTDAQSVSDPKRIKIYDVANAKGTPVNMHVSLVEADTRAAVERIVASHPATPFIIAHGGGGIGTDVMAQLLAAHPNMSFDLSGPLTPPTAAQPRPQGALTAEGTLKPEWRALFERFPDRFMFAMDVQSPQSVLGIPARVAAARKAFADLPLSTETAIANGNIQRVLKGCGGLAVR